MNRRKNLFIVASVVLASSSMGMAQISLYFWTDRIYRQTIDAVNYREGQFGMALRDGSATVTGCPLNGSADWFGPVPLLGCDIGATGYIVGGDIDNDGIRDDFSHWEVVSVTAAVGIEPSRPDLVRLLAAPPSTLSRSITFGDSTVIVYYNTQTESIRQYDLTGYFHIKDYTTRTEMDREIVIGQYFFQFPRLGAPDFSVTIPVTYQNIPEGFIRKNNVRQGFHFTKLNGEGLRWTADGFVEMDPRVINTLEWDGNNANLIFPAADVLYFAVRNMVPEVVGEPPADRDVLETTLFPGFSAPGTSRVLLDNALVKSIAIPPGFIPVTVPPLEGVAEVTLLRTVPSSQVATDNSTRYFQMPVRYVNTYEGWAAVSFPFGTPDSMRARAYDFDGDGKSNEAEWIAGTDPTDPTSHPAPPMLAFVQGRATRSTGTSTSGHYETSFAKLVGASPAISYQYEFSPDLKSWTTVGNDDPNWLLIETAEEIKIQSRQEKPTGAGYLRIRWTQAAPPEPTVFE